MNTQKTDIEIARKILIFLADSYLKKSLMNLIMFTPPYNLFLIVKIINIVVFLKINDKIDLNKKLVPNMIYEYKSP